MPGRRGRLGGFANGAAAIRHRYDTPGAIIFRTDGLRKGKSHLFNKEAVTNEL